MVGRGHRREAALEAYDSERVSHVRCGIRKRTIKIKHDGAYGCGVSGDFSGHGRESQC